MDILHFRGASDAAGETKQHRAKLEDEDDRRQDMFNVFKGMNINGDSADLGDREFSKFVNEVVAARQKANSQTFEHEKPMVELTGQIKRFNTYAAITNNPNLKGSFSKPSSYKSIDLNSVTSK